MSDIIQEIRSNNKEAVKAVYQQYAKDVYNFAKSITGDHDSALAATKKTFLTLFKNIQNGEEPANLRTAALKIAYDVAYQMASPKAEAVQPAPAPAEDSSYAQPMFTQRGAKAAPAYEPAAEEDYEEEYYEDEYEEEGYDDEYAEEGYEDEAYEDGYYDDEYDDYDDEYDTYPEEEDDFVPPNRPQDANREPVYMPKGKLQLDPVEEEPQSRKKKAAKQQPAARGKNKPAPAYEEMSKKRRKADQYDDYDDYYDEDYDDYEEEKPRKKGLFIFCIVLNVVLILILLWFLCGLLVNLGILPDIDLGHSWFNAHIYPLF